MPRCVVAVERIRLSLARSSVTLEGALPSQGRNIAARAENGDTDSVTVPLDASAREIVE
jgi:hypothetical protein